MIKAHGLNGVAPQVSPTTLATGGTVRSAGLLEFVLPIERLLFCLFCVPYRFLLATSPDCRLTYYSAVL